MVKGGKVVLAIGWFLFISVMLCGAQVSEPEAEVSASLRDLLLRLEKKVMDVKTLKTDFVQEKSLAALRNKITLTGRIYMKRPNKLVWHVDEPIRYSVLITEELIRQWDEETGRVQQIPLSKNPVIRTVMNQMTVWFNGHYAALLKDYDVSWVQESPVVLAFVPKGSSVVGKVVKEITIEFQQDETYLKSILIQEIGGDSTTITFLNTVLNVPLDSRSFEVKDRV